MMKAMRTLTGTLLLLLLLLQTACDGGESDAAVYNDLVLRLHADQSRAQVGKPIHMQFSVTNEGTQPYTLESKQIPVMDIDVEEAGTQQVYLRWSAQHPDEVAHRLEWKPGESKVIELVWTPNRDAHIYIIPTLSSTRTATPGP